MPPKKATCQHCDLHKPCIYNIPAFAKISGEDATAIVQLVHHREYKKGETLFNEGEQSGQLILFRHGKVKLVRYSLDGEEILVDILSKGDIYGGEEIFVDLDLAESGIVLEDCGVCMIPKADIRRLTLERPNVGLKLAEYFNQKLFQNRRLLEIISTKDTLRKLVMYLLYTAETNSSLELEISQAEIAASMNLTKETVNRKFAELQTARHIQVVGKKKLRILSPDGLSSYLNS